MYKNQNLKGLGMKLSAVSIAILPMLAGFSANAAVYNVQEVAEVTTMQYTYASALNNNDEQLVHGYGWYNFPIDISTIDFENERLKNALTDEQIQAAINGEIDSEIQDILIGYLRDNSSSLTVQKLGLVSSYIADTKTEPSRLVLRDSQGNLSNNEYLYDLNDSGIAIGVASTPFSLQNFTPTSTSENPEPDVIKAWVPELMHQTAVATLNNSVNLLLPIYTSWGGGFSIATAINENNVAVGFGSVDLDLEAIATLEQTCKGDSIPVLNCLYNHHTKPNNQPSVYNQLRSNFTYTHRALVWSLNSEGVPSQTPQQLGFLGDKHTGLPHAKEGFKSINYFSRAYGINNSGLIVGNSLYSNSDKAVGDDQVFRAPHATIFDGDAVIPIIDTELWLSSLATAVNDNNIVVGYANQQINSATRSKLFTYKYNSNELDFAQGFFKSSTTVANAINNNDIVVGRGEVIIDGTVDRRFHAFIYDITSGEFLDLNDLVDCMSPYTLVEANDINDKGEILATALVKRESRDSLGQVVLDTNGDPVLSDVTVAVKLTPAAGGEVENCNDAETEYERKSGSSGIVWLVSLLTVFGLRRKKLLANTSH